MPVWLNRIRRVVDLASTLFNVLGTTLILALVLLINTDVVMRSLFDSPLSGVPELVSLSIVAIVFLQIAHTVRVGRLTRADALLNVVARKWPTLRCWLEGSYNLIAAALLAVLFNASLPHFIKAWNRGTYVGSIGDFTAPVWPVKLIILIGCITLVLQFLLAAAEAFSAALHPSQRPLLSFFSVHNKSTDTV